MNTQPLQMRRADSDEARIIEQLLWEMIGGLIDHPEHLEVSVMEMNRSILCRVRAHYDDTGKVLGQKRANLRALSTVVAVVGMKLVRIVRLEILPATFGRPQPFTKFKTRDDWRQEKVEQILGTVTRALFNGPVKVLPTHFENTSIYEVCLQQGEMERIPWLNLGKALEVLFDAIGRSQGRLVSVILGPPGKSYGTDQPRGDGNRE